MGKTNKEAEKTRRWFLSLFSTAGTNATDQQKVKMLTADGKLVEIDKAVLEAATKKQKSSNKEIYEWMNNPSKTNNS